VRSDDINNVNEFGYSQTRSCKELIECPMKIIN
jgi:hypothetical protein